MKAKLEPIANVTVIVVALAVGFVVLRGKIAAPHIPRSVAAGDRLGQVPGIDWSRNRRTLVLALNSGCHFCQDSVPFYQRLVQAQRPGADDLEIVALFPNAPEAVHQLMKDERLALRSIPAVPLEKLGINGFPTLLLVGRDGRVERTWLGLLTPREELEVLSAISGAGQDCSASELPAFQMGGNKGCSFDTNGQITTKNRD
jgi:thiol-disulfide isomerase/thioredoxin